MKTVLKKTLLSALVVLATSGVHAATFSPFGGHVTDGAFTSDAEWTGLPQSFPVVGLSGGAYLYVEQGFR